MLLTPTEFRVLAAITSRPGEVVRRRTVVAAGWPDGAQVSENTIDSFLRRIRAKLESIGSPDHDRDGPRRGVPGHMSVEPVRDTTSDAVSETMDEPVSPAGRATPGSLRRRLVVLTGLLSALVALGLVVVVHLVLEGSASSAVDRVLADRVDAVVSSVGVAGGAVLVPDERLEPGVAVYDDTGRLVAGQVPPSPARRSPTCRR